MSNPIQCTEECTGLPLNFRTTGLAEGLRLAVRHDGATPQILTRTKSSFGVMVEVQFNRSVLCRGGIVFRTPGNQSSFSSELSQQINLPNPVLYEYFIFTMVRV